MINFLDEAENKSREMKQQESGTDVSEHHFGNIRSRNAKANLDNCQHAGAHADAVNSNTFSGMSKRNTSGSKTFRADELNAPLRRRTPGTSLSKDVVASSTALVRTLCEDSDMHLELVIMAHDKGWTRFPKPGGGANLEHYMATFGL
jgi:hypothetical protein